MVINIAAHKNTISIRAYKGTFKPKNKMDHNAFRNNWTPNSVKAF